MRGKTVASSLGDPLADEKREKRVRYALIEKGLEALTKEVSVPSFFTIY